MELPSVIVIVFDNKNNFKLRVLNVSIWLSYLNYIINKLILRMDVALFYGINSN